jgi:predicted phage terminase large subunit-like protein
MANPQQTLWATSPELQLQVQAAALLELKKRQAEEAQLRKIGSCESFHDYIARVMPEYEFYEWAEKLVQALQDVADGKLKRLMVGVPPRHGKSQLASRLFPAYFLHRWPTRFVGLATYDAGLSYGMSREARRFYREGGGVLAGDTANVGLWLTWGNGGMWAAGVGGAATGKGGHLLVVDDPIKGQREADSAGVRRDLHTWWTPTFRSRLEPEGAILVISTRWNKMDLQGFLLQLEEQAEIPDEWTIIDFPAFAEPDHERPVYPKTCRVVPDGRAPGEVLCPERYPAHELLAIKGVTQPRHWDALYQCRPTDAEGTIFKREWLNWYLPNEKLPRFSRIILSLDATFKDREDSDYVAFTAWGQQGSDYWLLDGVRERMDFNRTLAVLLNMGLQWRPSAVLIEDTANGPAIISTLKKRWSNLIAVTPDGSKEARAYSCQPVFIAGRVILPTEAPWLPDYLGDILDYPSGEADDYVDSTTQAIRWFENVTPMQLTKAQWGRGAPQQVQQPPLSWQWASGPAPAPETGSPGSPGRRGGAPGGGWGRWGN